MPSHAQIRSVIPGGILNAEQVQQMIMGNSVVGNIHGITYIQFFTGNNESVYQQEGEAPEVVEWWIEPDGKVCSKWDGAIINCYFARRQGRDIVWLGPTTQQGGQPQPIAAHTTIYRGNKTQTGRIRTENINNGLTDQKAVYNIGNAIGTIVHFR